MLFSDFLIESVEVRDFNVVNDNDRVYHVNFYVDDHLVDIRIFISGNKYDIRFSVDGSYSNVDVGHGVALIIFRRVIEIITEYLSKHKDKATLITFSSDDTPSRLKLYDRLSKILEKSGYLDYSYYIDDSEKQYALVKSGHMDDFLIIHDEIDTYDEYTASIILFSDMLRFNIDCVLRTDGTFFVEIYSRDVEYNPSDSFGGYLISLFESILTNVIGSRVDRISKIDIIYDIGRIDLTKLSYAFVSYGFNLKSSDSGHLVYSK